MNLKKIALTNGDDFALRNDDNIRMIFCSITLLLCSKIYDTR